MTECTATWRISLDTQCPTCKATFDLLNYPDYWEGGHLLTEPESGTERSKDIDVACPQCGHEFLVDLEYSHVPVENAN